MLGISLFSGAFALPFMEQFDEIPIFTLLISYALLYLVLSFITIVFNATLIACASDHLQQKECSVSQGFKIALGH